MLSLNIPSYSPPPGYRLSELPKPEMVNSEDVILRVHAASINPINVKKANGSLKLALTESYIHPLSVHKNQGNENETASHTRLAMTVLA